MKYNDLLVKNIKFRSLGEMFNLNTKFNIISGPCSVESLEQMENIARFLVNNNVNFIRGGAYKPRTSPYDFQGLGLEGLKILNYVKEEYKLITVSEIVDPRDVELGVKYIDVIQIGSRNMQNYSLLKEVGMTKKPVLLKRGMMSTIEEFILAAEYIISNGNENVIMCERGIRTFERSTRNTLDISCIAIIKKETTLPVIVDLSHSLGRKDIICMILKAVYAMEADGVMVEIHNRPEDALSDRKQQMDFCEFSNMLSTYNCLEVKGVS